MSGEELLPRLRGGPGHHADGGRGLPPGESAQPHQHPRVHLPRPGASHRGVPGRLRAAVRRGGGGGGGGGDGGPDELPGASETLQHRRLHERFQQVQLIDNLKIEIPLYNDEVLCLVLCIYFGERKIFLFEDLKNIFIQKKYLRNTTLVESQKQC